MPFFNYRLLRNKKLMLYKKLKNQANNKIKMSPTLGVRMLNGAQLLNANFHFVSKENYFIDI